MKIKSIQLLVATYAITLLVFSSCKTKEKTDDPAPTNNNVVSLLSGAQTGAALTGTITDFTLASNGSSVVLVAAQNATGKLVVVDVKDNNASAAAANTISAPITNFKSSIAAQLGVNASAISFANIEVNPISKSVYALVRNSSTSTQSIFKITNGGNTISQVDFSNATYSIINYSTTGSIINDMTWGDGKLFFSYSNASTLDGQVATVTAPFTHNTSATTRATTVFKSNWGNMYNTDAPLESLTYGEVDGEKRLMGVTVCAPGFSFKTSDITSGTGLLQVKEYFNLNTGIAIKVFCVTKAQTTYLVEFHEDGRIVRIGEKYLNESMSANVNNGRFLLTFSGNPSATLTDEDIKVVAARGTYVMAAKYSDTKLLVVSTNGTLSLLDI